MTQKARPVASDILTGNWTIVPLYQKINEPNFDDTTLITSGNNPAGDACEVRLAVLSWPQNTAVAGSQTLTIRLKKTDVSPLGVSVALVQGSNIIAARNFQPSQTFAPYVVTLSALEIARITDVAVHFMIVRFHAECRFPDRGAAKKFVLFLQTSAAARPVS